jgi:hypothetical protein
MTGEPESRKYLIMLDSGTCALEGIRRNDIIAGFISSFAKVSGCEKGGKTL